MKLIGKLFIIGGFIYLVYRIMHSEEQQKVAIGFEDGQQEIKQANSNIIISLFAFIFGVIEWFFSTIWWLFMTFLSIITFLWSIISYLWAIVVLIINAVYMTFIYYEAKRRRQYQIRTQLFFQLFLFLVVIPFIFNFLLAYRQFTYNLLLPLQLAIFVDCLGSSQNLQGRSIRNFVFFTIICSFI